MTYDHWKTTNPADAELGPEPPRCAYCNEAHTRVDSTWQQWQCGACGSWNDREEPPEGYDDQPGYDGDDRDEGEGPGPRSPYLDREFL